VIPVQSENVEGWHPIPLPDVLLGVDASTMQAFLTFQAAVDAHEQLVLQDISEAGTQPSQVTVLRMVATYEGLCQRDIADLLKISRARVTTVLQSLEEAGAIRRVRDKKDQRLTRVYLTDIGRSIDQAKESLRTEHINAVFASLTEEERAELRRALGAVTRRIRALIKSGAAPAPGDS
jgi:DNA-binding MarR family transcriptional regulator